MGMAKKDYPTLIEDKRIPTILVAGTWGFKRSNAWWRVGSEFYNMAKDSGVYFFPEYLYDQFIWSTEIDGVDGNDSDWITAGQALRCYVKAYGFEKVNIIAHSHGGNVVFYSLSQGFTLDGSNVHVHPSLKINTLITVATPVRKDMWPVYEAGSKYIKNHKHIYTREEDYWQMLGSINLSNIFTGNIFSTRKMPYAHENIYEPDQSHTSLLDPYLWSDKGWFDYVHGDIVI